MRCRLGGDCAYAAAERRETGKSTDLCSSLESGSDVTLQRALLSDLDKGYLLGGKDASAPRCLARPGNAATNDEWLLSPKGWKDEQRMEDGLK